MVGQYAAEALPPRLRRPQRTLSISISICFPLNRQSCGDRRLIRVKEDNFRSLAPQGLLHLHVSTPVSTSRRMAFLQTHKHTQLFSRSGAPIQRDHHHLALLLQKKVHFMAPIRREESPSSMRTSAVTVASPAPLFSPWDRVLVKVPLYSLVCPLQRDDCLAALVDIIRLGLGMEDYHLVSAGVHNGKCHLPFPGKDILLKVDLGHNPLDRGRNGAGDIAYLNRGGLLSQRV